MKTLKLISKGVLLWVTALAILIFILGVESIYEHGYYVHAILICAALYYTCYKVISKEEFDILTFAKLFDELEE